MSMWEVAKTIQSRPASKAHAATPGFIKRALCVLLAAVLTAGLMPARPAAAHADTQSSQAARAAQAAQTPQAAQAPQAVQPSSASQANHHQLALLVRFADDATGDGNTGQNEKPEASTNTPWKSFMQAWTGYEGSPSLSLHDYIAKVTGGTVKLDTAFPQTRADGYGVDYLTLPQTRASYAAMGPASSDAIVADAVAALNKRGYDASALRNSQGYLDNLFVLVELGEATAAYGDPWWPHQAHYGQTLSVGAGASAPKVGSYVIMGTDRVPFTGVIAHEFLHSLGVKDLYRGNTSSGGAAAALGSEGPVGLWDIMDATLYKTWPLAVTREDLGARNAIVKKEPVSATYTLKVSDPDYKNYCAPPALRFSTPASSSEYFVVEYRRKANDTSLNPNQLAAMDTYLSSSGLVVYRVNEACKPDGNKGQDNDYLYVFREGETDTAKTGRGDGKGDLTHAAVGLPAYGGSRATIGTTDPTTGLLDGALTYSSGRNSGIQIEVTAQTADSITFNVTFPDFDAFGFWNLAQNADGTTPLPASEASVVSAAADQTHAYELVGARSGVTNKMTFSAFSFGPAASGGEDGWSTLGAPIENLEEARIFAAGSDVYVAGYGVSASGALQRVYRFDKTARSWASIDGTGIESGGYFAPRIAQVGARTYCLTGNASGGAELHEVKAGSSAGTGGTLARVGQALPIQGVSQVRLLSVGGKPAVLAAVTDHSGWPMTGSAKLFVLQSDGSWAAKTVRDGVAQFVEAVPYGEGALCAVGYQGSDVSTQVMLYRLDANGNVAASYDPNQKLQTSETKPFGLSMAVQGGDLYLGMCTQDGYRKAVVYRAPAEDVLNLSRLGDAVVAPVSDLTLASTPKRVYAATVDASGVADLRWFAAVGTPGPDPVDPKPDPNPKPDPEPTKPVVVKVPSAVAGLTYTGAAQVGVKAAKGYVLSGTVKAAAAGTYVARVTPAAGYAWNTAGDRSTKKITWKIQPASVSRAAVWLGSSSFTYDGTAKKPAPTVKVSGKTLKAGTDYTVSYRNNVNPGTAIVTVTGKGNYAGTLNKSFAIARASLAKASVSVASTLPYSGKALKPAVTVKLGGKALKNGTDYTVSYKNNAGSSKAGSTAKATVTVTGKGNYAGSVSKTYQIKTPSIQYYVHRQTYGWEAKYSKHDGVQSGTTGQKKRLEGIYVRLANKPVSGSIQYRTHVQKIGWQGWRSEGQMSGTTGKKYRLEAIQIKLTGEMAKKYDVYYRVHAQKFGWMGWAKNGASAGTAGYAYRLESIQIKLVPKGGAAPASADGVPSTKGKAAFSQKDK